MNTFGVGELVRVLEDMESVKRLQAGHGEWTDSMAPVCSFSLIIYTLILCIHAVAEESSRVTGLGFEKLII